MLGVLITIVGLVVYWGRLVVDWCMVHSMMGNNRGMVDSMVDCMMNSRGCMVNIMSSKNCEWDSRATSHKRD